MPFKFNPFTGNFDSQRAAGGDVTGAASSTDNAITRFNGTGGKTIQNSSATVDDNGSVNIPSGQNYKINGTNLAAADVGAEPADSTILKEANLAGSGSATTPAKSDHDHTGTYEPADSTILKEADLAGSGSATTPAKSDHDHSGVYEAAGAVSTHASVTATHGATGAVVGTTNTQTLTNKRVDPRVSSEASSATPTINTDNVDAHKITALATNITSFTTNLSGTPVDFQKLIVRITDSGSGQTIAWGASFEAKGVDLPVAITAGKTLTIGFIYDSVSAKWGCVASVETA